MMLVSLADTKRHLRMDHDDDDLDITLKIHAASGAVLNYLKSGADSFLDSNGQVIEDSNLEPVGVPFEVQAAVLILVAEWYKNREAKQDGAVNPQFGYGYLPHPVIALLYPLRDPACE